jgi:hypothetical protein
MEKDLLTLILDSHNDFKFIAKKAIALLELVSSINKMCVPDAFDTTDSLRIKYGISQIIKENVNEIVGKVE